jgi:hypothetical protein
MPEINVSRATIMHMCHLKIDKKIAKEYPGEDNCLLVMIPCTRGNMQGMKVFCNGSAW